MQEQPQQKLVPLLAQAPEQQALAMQLSFVVPDCKDIREIGHHHSKLTRGRGHLVAIPPCYTLHVDVRNKTFWRVIYAQ